MNCVLGVAALFLCVGIVCLGTYIYEQATVITVIGTFESAEITTSRCSRCVARDKDGLCVSHYYYQCFHVNVHARYELHGVTYPLDDTKSFDDNYYAAQHYVTTAMQRESITIYVDGDDPTDSSITRTGVSDGWALLATFFICTPCIIIGGIMRSR